MQDARLSSDQSGVERAEHTAQSDASPARGRLSSSGGGRLLARAEKALLPCRRGWQLLWWHLEASRLAFPWPMLPWAPVLCLLGGPLANFRNETNLSCQAERPVFHLILPGRKRCNHRYLGTVPMVLPSPPPDSLCTPAGPLVCGAWHTRSSSHSQSLGERDWIPGPPRPLHPHF